MPWGVAAAAVTAAGAIGGSSMASSAAKDAAAPTRNAQNALYQQAENIAGTPYTAYTGTQVAGLSGNQQRAIDQSQTAVGQGQAYIDKAGQQADFIGGNTWNSATASKYMNPYTQNVTNLALNKENQSYASSVNAANASAAQSGSFGGDRATLTNAALTAGHNYNQGAIEATGQANAYDSAVKTWQADNERAQSAATSYQNSGNDITNMNSDQIKDLLATGTADQSTQQMKDSANYGNYIDQRSWAANQLQSLESAAGRTPVLAATPSANWSQALTGTGAALAGYFGKSNSTNNNNNTGVSDPTGQNWSAGDPGYSYSGGVDGDSLPAVQSDANIGGGTTTYYG